MKLEQTPSALRDALMLLLLVLLAHHAIKRACKIVYRNSSQTIAQQSSFTVHEVDPHIKAQLQLIEHQLETARHLPLSAAQEQERAGITARFAELKKRYLHTSPATALLGPLGTTAVVLKERDLNRKIVKELQDFSALLHQLLPYMPYTPSNDIDELIEHNQQAIKKIQLMGRS